MIHPKKLARQCMLDRKEYVPDKSVEEVRRELGLSDVIKMDSCENPLGTSPMALEAMINELKQKANRYPESLCHDLAHRLASVHDLRPEQFLFDTGADGVITVIGLTFVDPGDEVIFGEVTFPAYENITTKMDGVCVKVPLTEDYRLDVDGFVSAITPRTRMLFLCNPNNPTATITTKEEFQRLLKSTPETVIIVSDEAYCEFADDPSYPLSVPYLREYPNLIIVRTFSKIMGLAGLRVGYAMAHPDVINVMRKAREPFPVSGIAQAGALAALDDADFVNRTLAVNKEGREQYYRAFEEMGLQYYPSQANFIFVDLRRPAQPVFEAMLRDGVIVRPLIFAGAPNGMRISVGLKHENERTIASLKKALAKVQNSA